MFAISLVLMLCTEKLKVKYSKVFTTKVVKDNTYYGGKLSTSSALQTGLHELLDLGPVIILTAFSESERPLYYP
jgi:hypothetical protein